MLQFPKLRYLKLTDTNDSYVLLSSAFLQEWIKTAHLCSDRLCSQRCKLHGSIIFPKHVELILLQTVSSEHLWHLMFLWHLLFPKISKNSSYNFWNVILKKHTIILQGLPALYSSNQGIIFRGKLRFLLFYTFKFSSSDHYNKQYIFV